MPMDSESSDTDEFAEALSATDGSGASAASRLRSARAKAENKLREARRAAEEMLRSGADTLNARTQDFDADEATRLFKEAWAKTRSQIEARPVTAAFAGLGLGFFIGVIVAGGRR